MLVKEELVEYLTKGYIHVSRQDYLFFSNLVKIASEQRVTTGQNKLLDKLVDKYKRQLVGERLDTEYLKRLSWRFNLLESKPEYTEAHLSLENDKLILRSPFNKKFISTLKSLGEDKTFDWNKELKAYTSPFYGFAFRAIYKIAKDIFGDVNLDSNLQKVLEELQQYDKYVWSPTLVESNGNYYIGAINEQIYEFVKDVEINLSATCLYLLSKLAVHSNISLNKEQSFALNFLNQFDTSEIDELVKYIISCKIKEVGILSSKVKTHSFIANLTAKLESAGINVQHHGNSLLSMFSTLEVELIISVVGNGYNSFSFGPRKVVKLLNSTPIQVK